jgi:UDP-N-acetylglucosamine:LPS N-acetylglucosamine transferase
MTIVFDPGSSGASKLHETVPEAAPDLPPEVDHVTETTPTLSEAVPEMRMLEDDVNTVLVDGLTIFRVGGTLSASTVRVT